MFLKFFDRRRLALAHARVSYCAHVLLLAHVCLDQRHCLVLVHACSLLRNSIWPLCMQVYCCTCVFVVAHTCFFWHMHVWSSRTQLQCSVHVFSSRACALVAALELSMLAVHCTCMFAFKRLFWHCTQNASYFVYSFDGWNSDLHLLPTIY